MPIKRKIRIVRRRVRRRKLILRSRKSFPLLRGVRTGLNIPKLQKLRYVQNFTLTPSTGSLVTQNFGANDGFHPDKTGTGHQPMRWDQMALFYNHYIVVGSKITVKRVGHLATSTPAVPSVWGLFLNDSVIGPTDYTLMIEQGRTKYRLDNSTNAMRTSSITMGYSTKKFFNVKDVKDNMTRLGSDVLSSPTELAVFTVWAQALNKTDTVTTQTYIATIDFAVLYSESSDMPQS